jgi:hypothetical protein
MIVGVVCWWSGRRGHALTARQVMITSSVQDQSARTLQLLKTARAHLVYFYCHGGVQNNIPFILVGYQEKGITRDNIRAKKIRWDEPRPVVFINGCHTTAVRPEAALEFVSAFIENAQAAGVIGTEVTVFEHLARRFAEEFLIRFLDGPVFIVTCTDGLGAHAVSDDFGTRNA